LLALPTPPPSPLSPYSSPLPQIPSPPLPISSPLPQIPSPPLPISSPPPNGPTYVEGSLGSRAAGIRQRDALPSPIHETEIPEICLPLRKRPCRTTPGPGYEEDEIIYSQLDDARYDRALLRARVNMLYRDRPFHRRTALLMEEEARSEITEFQAADRRRQTVITDLLKADHRRQRQLVESLKIVKSLKTQMIELQC
ncbi:hypothetical protein Tco_1158132, partial [Tanacetum coccineum]